jgi:Ni,Fe-hydrogenase III small subunit
VSGGDKLRRVWRNLRRPPAQAPVQHPDPTAVHDVATRLQEAGVRLLGRGLCVHAVNAGSCGGCELELRMLDGVVHDLARHGLRFVDTPRHADVLLVTGPVTRALQPALLQAWAFFRARRAWLAAGLCQPTYELVLRNAILRGRILAPGFRAAPAIRAAWCAARWTGPSPGQIDPLKEVKAAEMRLALRLSTRTRETAELTGDDWEQVAAEFAEEEAMLAALGITPPADAGTVPADQPLPEAEDQDAQDPADLPDREAA